MKTAPFFFLMIVGAILLQASSPAQSDSAPQPTASQNGKKSAGNQRKDAEVRDEKNQTRSGKVDEDQGPSARLKRSATKRRPSAGHSKPFPSHQSRPAKTPLASHLRSATPENGIGFHFTGSDTSSGVPSKTVSHRSAPLTPPAVAVNGQQFKTPRDPGAHLASSGGPLTTTRGTAAISGTNMKRKP